MDADVARAGLDANGGTASIDVALDVMALDGTVHGDGWIAVDRTRARAGVEGEVGAIDAEGDGA